MKKLIVIVMLASFTGAVIAQQAPSQQQGPSQAHVDKDKKEKKKHHHHKRHEHKPTDKK